MHRPFLASQPTNTTPFSPAANPLEVRHCFWIVARRQQGSYPSLTQRSGKWLFYVPRAEVPTTWEHIRYAVEQGLLGSHAKVATAKPNPHTQRPGYHVICAYTYDYEDRADVDRVRHQLRSMGITDKIGYKADAATSAGLYSAPGHRVCLFYE